MESPRAILERLRQKGIERDNGNASVEEGIGVLVRDFRISLGLTPTKFAKELKISVQSVHRWEATGKIPSHRIAQCSKLVKDEMREVISTMHRENGDELAGKLLDAVELLRHNVDGNREA